VCRPLAAALPASQPTEKSMKDGRKGKATERQSDRATVSYRKRVGSGGGDEPVKTKSANKVRGGRVGSRK